MFKLISGLALALMSICAFGQVIDAEAYIKQNGFKKKAAAGFGIFYTTIKKVKADDNASIYGGSENHASH